MLVPSLLLVTALNSFTSSRPDTPAGKADIREVRQEVGDLSGYYTCKGAEVGGKAYSGIAVLTKKNDVYSITWLVGGGSTFSGLAIRQGDTLAASWVIPGERGMVRGVNLYRIEPSATPRLVGRWATLPGPGIHQTETLTFLKKLDAEDE